MANINHLNFKVPKRLLDVISSAESATKLKPSVVGLLDASHLSNLTDQNERGFSKSTWTQKVIDKITQLTKRHYTGKGLEEFLDAATED